MLVEQYEGNTPLAIDVRITSAYTGPNNLENATKEKKNKHEQDCHRNGLKFLPFIINTFGNFNSECTEIFTRVATELSHYRTENPKIIAQRIKRRCQFEAMKSVVISMEGHRKGFPTLPFLDDQ